jgi:hypothetical protein
MVSSDVHTQLAARAVPQAVPAAFDADFDTRWAAWIARGRVHDQRVRHNFLVWGGVLAMAAAAGGGYALLR